MKLFTHHFYDHSITYITIMANPENIGKWQKSFTNETNTISGTLISCGKILSSSSLWSTFYTTPWGRWSTLHRVSMNKNPVKKTGKPFLVVQPNIRGQVTSITQIWPKPSCPHCPNVLQVFWKKKNHLYLSEYKYSAEETLPLSWLIIITESAFLFSLHKTWCR